MVPEAQLTIHLSLHNGMFLMRFSINGQALSIASGRSVPDLKRFIGKNREFDAYTLELPPAEAQYIVSRAQTKSRYGLAFETDASVRGFTFGLLTDQLKMTLSFDVRERRLRFDLPEGAYWMDKEWILYGCTALFLNDSWMSRIIHTKNLQEDDFDYLMRHLDEPYLDAKMRLGSEALYEITIAALSDELIEMRLIWRFPRNTWVWPTNGKKYVVIDQQVYHIPGEVHDEFLPKLFPEGDIRTVTREEMTVLYKLYRGILRPFIDDALLAQLAPSWFPEELRVHYQCRVREEKGRRVSYAVPLIDIGNETYDTLQISQQIGDGELNLQQRRLSLETLLAIGIGPFGYFSDGRPLGEKLLKSEEILRRTFVDFNGIEHLLQLEEGLWREEGTPRELLSSHIDFLLHFGLHGAAVLNGISCETLLDGFIHDYLASTERRSKTLIVLRKEHFAGLAPQSYSSGAVQILQGLKSDPALNYEVPVHVVLYATLEKYSDLLQQKWDLIIFAEPDRQFKRSSILYTKACSLQSTMRLCFLSEALGYQTANIERLVMKLCKWRSSRNRELDALFMRSLLPLPPLSTASLARDRQRERAAIFENASESFMRMLHTHFGTAQAGTPIPSPEPSNGGHKLFEGFAVVRLTKGTPPHYYRSFLQEYNTLITDTSQQCSFVPCKITSSGAVLVLPEQRAWYLYWRSEFLKNNYLQSDEGYLFLMLVEIANGIGFKDRKIGWQMLLSLQKHYSGIAPRIEKVMAEVILDYAVLYSDEKIWRDLLGIPALRRFELIGNLQLQIRVIEDKALLGLDELLVYLNMNAEDVCRQVLSANPSTEEIEEFFIVLQRVVAAIQSEVLERTGQSLFRFFTPARHHTVGGDFFHGLPNRIDRKFTLSYFTWIRHQPLQDFWLTVMKEVGNRYRKNKKIKGQLKIGFLGEFYLGIIDSLLPRQAVKRSSGAAVTFLPPKQPIELSRELLDKLRGEAEEVQRALATDAYEEQQIQTAKRADLWTSGHFEIKNEPEFGSASDETSWQEFFAQLQPRQRETLEHLSSGSEHDRGLRALAMRHNTMLELLLDEINEIFMRHFGDLLIETDAAMPGINTEYRDALSIHLKRA